MRITSSGHGQAIREIAFDRGAAAPAALEVGSRTGYTGWSIMYVIVGAFAALSVPAWEHAQGRQ